MQTGHDAPDMTSARATLAGISRSFDVYYRNPERTRRMDQLNASFVTKGGLAFDIGAHVGDRTASFLRLGASVVALEPQPLVFRALRLIHGRTPQANLLCQAAGSQSAEIDMYVNSRNPTVSTLSRDLVVAAQDAAAWKDQVWDTQVRVPVTTLDTLISQYGQPDFVKIDVEGHELGVLEGLSAALPTLSFEFTTLQRDVAAACVHRLGDLGHYKFNISLGEDHVMHFDTWVDAHAISAHIADLPTAANSGDIYARRI